MRSCPCFAVIVCIGLLSLPGCSGCVSEVIKDAARQPTQQQQPEEHEKVEPAGADPKPPSEPKDSSTAPVDSATVAQPQVPSETNQPSASPAPTDPARAFSQAKSLHEQAKRKSREGDAAGAFQDASAAWNLVRRFSKDANCRQLEKEIAGELGQLAKNANATAGGSAGIDGKTLIEK